MRKGEGKWAKNVCLIEYQTESLLATERYSSVPQVREGRYGCCTDNITKIKLLLCGELLTDLIVEKEFSVQLRVPSLVVSIFIVKLQEGPRAS